MAVFVLAGLLLLLIFAALLFTRGGAREPVTAIGPSTPRRPTSRVDLAAATEALIGSLGLAIERRDADEGYGPGFVATNPEPLTGGRVYVRAFVLPDGEAVRGADVLNALDAARDEGVSKTILISPNGFTDEAILAADGRSAELIDGQRLDTMLRRPVTP